VKLHENRSGNSKGIKRMNEAGSQKRAHARDERIQRPSSRQRTFHKVEKEFSDLPVAL
jgi:hypothetical protein